MNEPAQRTLHYVLYFGGARWREGDLEYVTKQFYKYRSHYPGTRMRIEEHLIRRDPGHLFWKLIRRTVLRLSHPVHRQRWAKHVPIWHM